MTDYQKIHQDERTKKAELVALEKAIHHHDTHRRKNTHRKGLRLVFEAGRNFEASIISTVITVLEKKLANYEETFEAYHREAKKFREERETVENALQARISELEAAAKIQAKRDAARVKKLKSRIAELEAVAPPMDAELQR